MRPKLSPKTGKSAGTGRQIKPSLDLKCQQKKTAAPAKKTVFLHQNKERWKKNAISGLQDKQDTVTRTKREKRNSSGYDTYDFNEMDGVITRDALPPASTSSRHDCKRSRNMFISSGVAKHKSSFENGMKNKIGQHNAQAKRKGSFENGKKNKNGQSNAQARTDAVKFQKFQVNKKTECGGKTSTPLLPEQADSALKDEKHNATHKLPGFCRVSLPKLNLDLSVTPIHYISTPDSPKQRTVKNSKINVGNFTGPEKRFTQSEATPCLLSKKSDCSTVMRKTALAQQQFKSPIIPALQNPDKVLKQQINSDVSVALERKDLKRKRSPREPLKAINKTFNSTRKNDQLTTTQKKSKCPRSKQECHKIEKNNKLSSKLKMSSVQQKKSSRKQTISDSSGRTSVTYSSASFKKKSTSEITPNIPTPVIGSEQTGKKMIDTPDFHDSGISLGSDTSTSSVVDTCTPSLPGFMEEEPLKEFSSSPLSTPSLSYDEPMPVSTIKCSSKVYKPGGVRRKKGQYSTSKLDAWANAVNESMQDVESFELYVE